jgi:hypothetical protein
MPLPEPPIASIGNRHPFLVAFRSARFRFRLRAVSCVELPAEKGSTFHGALGHVLKRQAERAECLCLLYHRDATLDSETKRGLVDRARAIEITSHDFYWNDWSRYSGRQHTWMKFGGFLGGDHLPGRSHPVPTLVCASNGCNIGGKSSFGLGRYTIEPPRQG